MTRTEPRPEHLAEARRITWIGLGVNVVLVVLKLIGGIAGHSQVLIADAMHSLSDLVTDIAVIIGSRHWGKPADEEHPYGHGKLETLVTLLIGVALVLVGYELIVNASMNLKKQLLDAHVAQSPNLLAFGAALISVFAKEILYKMTVKVGIRIKSPAVVANAWHHRSDALSSIPASIAVAACLLLGNQFVFLDPVGTIVVGCMIFYAAWEIIRPTFSTLLDTDAWKEQHASIQSISLTFPEVRGVHKIRTRSVGSTGIIADMHIQVDPLMNVRDSHCLSHRLHDRLLEEGPDIVDVSIHIEPDGDPMSSIVLKKAPD